VLANGDILNYDPGVDLYDNLTAPAGSTVNLLSGYVDFVEPIEGTLNLNGGNVSTPLFARDATINLGAGSLSHASIQGSVLNIVGGGVQAELSAVDSIVNLSAGNIALLGSIPGSTLNMSGGAIASKLFGPLQGGGIINITGGLLGDLAIADGVVLNLSGGQIGVAPSKSFFSALPGATVHLLVQQAQIDGVDVAGLSRGSTVPVDVTNRVGELTGVLRDGSPFHFDLAATSHHTGNYPRDPTIVTDPSHGAPIPPKTRVEVLITLVPEPTSTCLVALGMAGAIPCRSAMYRRSRKLIG
jgi:hypothetical protein